MKHFNEIKEYNAYLDYKIKSYRELKKSLTTKPNILHLEEEIVKDYEKCYTYLKKQKCSTLKQVKINLLGKLGELQNSAELDNQEIIMYETLNEIKEKI